MTSEEINDQVYAMGKKARSAALALAVLSEEKKNEILRSMAGGIRAAAPEILEANAKDIAAGEERGLTGAMLDRLRLDETRLEAVAAGIKEARRRQNTRRKGGDAGNALPQLAAAEA